MINFNLEKLMSSYQTIMSAEISDRGGYSPCSIEEEHDYVLLCVARSIKTLKPTLEKALANIEMLLEQARRKEHLAFQLSSSEASWNRNGGPDASITAAHLAATRAMTLTLLGRSSDDNVSRTNYGFLDVPSLIQILAYAAQQKATS